MAVTKPTLDSEGATTIGEVGTRNFSVGTVGHRFAGSDGGFLRVADDPEQAPPADDQPIRSSNPGTIRETASATTIKDWYILFYRKGANGLYKVDTQEEAIARACELMQAGIVVREIGRFDERRRAIRATTLVKICAERRRQRTADTTR